MGFYVLRNLQSEQPLELPHKTHLLKMFMYPPSQITLKLPLVSL